MTDRIGIQKNTTGFMKREAAIQLISGTHFQNRKNWADLGCGNGLFTAALAHWLEPGSSIYAVDRNKDPLRPGVDHAGIKIEKITLDFVRDELPVQHLDGILMANSLHYVQDKPAFIHKMENHLNPAGIFLIVEYNTDTANRWVPYPLSVDSLQSLFRQQGYQHIRLLRHLPSLYHAEGMYAAVVEK